MGLRTVWDLASTLIAVISFCQHGSHVGPLVTLSYEPVGGFEGPSNAVQALSKFKEWGKAMHSRVLNQRSVLHTSSIDML